MTALGTRPAERSRAALGRWRWQLLRVLMVGLWVAWAGTLWWTSPRVAPLEALHADVASGTATSAFRAGRSGDTGLLTLHQPLRETPHGLVLAWTTSDGRLWYAADPDQGLSESAQRSLSGTGSSPALTWALRTARETGLPADPPTSVAEVVRTAALALGFVATLGFLVFGPAPRRGTRWAWFWCLGLPLGSGLLVWLAREAPWSQRAAALPEPVRGTRRQDDPRTHGLGGFIVLVLGTAGIALAETGLAHLVGTWLVPG